MREANYKDTTGRFWAVLLPNGASEQDAAMGVPLGPPSLAALGLSLEVEVRLHNQLFSRRIFIALDARRRRQDVVAAIMAAFKVDSERIIEIYVQQEQEVITDGRNS